MGVAFKNGSDARALHHGLTTVGDGGIRVLSCEPAGLDVWRCRKDGSCLQIGFGLREPASKVRQSESRSCDLKI